MSAPTLRIVFTLRTMCSWSGAISFTNFRTASFPAYVSASFTSPAPRGTGTYASFPQPDSLRPHIYKNDAYPELLSHPCSRRRKCVLTLQRSAKPYRPRIRCIIFHCRMPPPGMRFANKILLGVRNCKRQHKNTRDDFRRNPHCKSAGFFINSANGLRNDQLPE